MAKNNIISRLISSKLLLFAIATVLICNVYITIFIPSQKADSPPSGVILFTPANNAYVNDTTPVLSWYPSFDADGDPLKYQVEVYDIFNNLVAYNLTDFFITTWEIMTTLVNGQTYYWHVRANDTGNQTNSTGSWSPYWFFTIDMTPPSILSGSANFNTYTGNIFNIYANCTDNSGISHSTLYYKKQSDNGFKTQAMVESFTDNYYISSELLDVNTTNDEDDYFYFVIVEDVAGNKVNYSNSVNSDFQIVVIDNILPEVNYGSAQIITTTDDEFSIFVNCNDNIQISEVNLFIRKQGNPWQYMTIDNYYLDNYFVNYSKINIDLGLNTSDGIDCEYYILIFDTSNNIINYTNPLGGSWQIEVIDNDEPDVIDGSGNVLATTGDHFPIFVNFTDNVGITTAVIHIRNLVEPNQRWYNLNMEKVSENNYSLSYDDLKSYPGLQMDTTSGGSYEYYILGYDFANNFYNYSQDSYVPWNIFVFDNDLPILTSGSQDFECTTDDPFTIYANFTDNIDVATVRIYISQLEDTTNGLDENWLYTWMTKKSEGAVSRFTISYDSLKLDLGIDTAKGGKFGYYTLASDPTGNVYRSPETDDEFWEITIFDNDPPLLLNGSGDIALGLDDDFVIFVELYDNIDVSSATLYYKPLLLESDLKNIDWYEYEMNISDLITTGKFRCTAAIMDLNIDLIENQNYIYYVIAGDQSNNSINYGSQSIPHNIVVIDNIKPVIESWTTRPQTLTSDWASDLVLTVTVSDTGGSGLNDKSVMISYRRGSYDLDVIDYTYMSLKEINEISDPIIKTVTEWQFIIPKPSSLNGTSGDKDGWALVEGEYVSFIVHCEDLEGNIFESTELNKYVNSGDLSNQAPEVQLLSPNGNENFTGTHHIFWIATDGDNDELVINIEFSDDNGITWQLLCSELENTGTYRLETTTLKNGDEYLIKIIASDGELNSSDKSEAIFSIYYVKIQNAGDNQDEEIEFAGVKLSGFIPMIITVIIIVIIISSAGFIGGTEIGKYKFLTLCFVPLYNKLHKEQVLDNFIRGQIYGYIKAKPGEHYNAIKNTLELNNGTFVHHVRILEKEEYVYSKRDGLYTRFYPKGIKATYPEIPTLNDFQKNIIDKIRANPGITQHEIVSILGANQKTVSYNLTKLTRDNILYIDQQGREKKYFINYEEIQKPEDKVQPQIPIPQSVQTQQTNTPAQASTPSPIPAAEPSQPIES